MRSSKTIAGSRENELRGKSQWQSDSLSSVVSREDSDLNTYYNTTDELDLHVVQRKQITPSYPIIPATKCEKLTFIRSYVSITCKTDVIGIQFINFNQLFWNFLVAAFFKTLPSCYFYLFLGSYSGHYHLFLTKMAPLFHGLTVWWILDGTLKLVFSTSLQVMILNFICTGILYQRPWNRCMDEVYNMPINNTHLGINVSCYTQDDFIARASNASILFSGYEEAYFYDQTTNETFQISHFFNAHLIKAKLEEIVVTEIRWFMIYGTVIWTSSLLFINQIFKKNIWKILHVAHWVLAFFFTCIVVFIYIYAANDDGITTVSLESSPELAVRVSHYLDLLSESMTTPPILHMLASRSKTEVKLSTDSALIVTSNTIFYLFRAYVVNKVLRYCVYVTKAQLHLAYSDCNILFLWPIFFNSLHLDSILTIPFCILIFVVDYFTFIISLQCLIEVVVCEWQILKRWHAAAILILLSVFCQIDWYNMGKWVIVCATRIVTCTELIIVSFFYPLDRMLEDITFHNGIAPSFLTVLGFRKMFIYYFCTAFFASPIFGYFLPDHWRVILIIYFVAIFVVGLLVKLYYIISKKKSCKMIFVPIKNWGPYDFTLRLLRKKYDSSKHIQSQGPRDLSRYLIQKAEPNLYKIDLRYDPLPKSMMFVRFGNYLTNRIKNIA